LARRRHAEVVAAPLIEPEPGRPATLLDKFYLGDTHSDDLYDQGEQYQPERVRPTRSSQLSNIGRKWGGPKLGALREGRDGEEGS
jgi:hypothetical protein